LLPNILTKENTLLSRQDSLIKRRSSIAIAITQVEGKITCRGIVLLPSSFKNQ
jgi:hypothetical protein